MNIDPFAPGDSPQHPSRWRDGAPLAVEDALANTYQWRRDHFAMASEADQDIPEDVLEGRHERYAEYLEEFGTPDEQQPDTEVVPFPVLLRRAALAELEDDDEHDEWTELFERQATAEEQDPMWVEDVLPDLAELRARAAATEATEQTEATEATEQGAPADETASELPEVPKSNALKEDWVEYALAVDKARGGDLTTEQANAMSIADLKAAYKPQAD